MTVKEWTTRDERILEDLYPMTPNKDIAQILGRSLAAIEARARNKSLNKSPANFAQPRERKTLYPLPRTLDLALRIVAHYGETNPTAKQLIADFGMALSNAYKWEQHIPKLRGKF